MAKAKAKRSAIVAAHAQVTVNGRTAQVVDSSNPVFKDLKMQRLSSGVCFVVL